MKSSGVHLSNTIRKKLGFWPNFLNTAFLPPLYIIVTNQKASDTVTLTFPYPPFPFRPHQFLFSDCRKIKNRTSGGLFYIAIRDCWGL